MAGGTTFLGLGAMGSALAGAALDAGRPTVVWNRSPGRADPLATRGAVVARTAAEAVTGDTTIVVCLFDHASVREVLAPIGDTLAGRTVINLTTTTPGEARESASWAAGHDAVYLDGGIMAVPEMIGRPGAAILYSGSARAFEEQRALRELWGAGRFFGADAGMASLYDMAMLSGMYSMIAGFLHGAAMVGAAGVPAGEFAAAQVQFLTAMTAQLAGYATTVDGDDYAGPGQQSLRFTATALDTLLRATTEQGVAADVLAPVHEVVLRQIGAGFGDQGTARIYEELRGAR
jgi:3-hydroxyisobutyrate dehydrogenase-like beta-hydroxyacid dehydrogenase